MNRRPSRPTLRTLVALGILIGAPARAHITSGTPATGCDIASDAFLFCESAALRREVCACNERTVRGCLHPMGRLLGATNDAIRRALRAAEAGDRAGRDAGIQDADTKLDKVARRLDRILRRRRASTSCRDSAAAAIDAFALTMDERLGAFGVTTTSTTTTSTTVGGGGPTTTTTTADGPTLTTTSTTLPPGIACFGTIAFYDDTQVDFGIWCNQEMTQFAIVVPGGRNITADTGPVGFTCSQPTMGRYVCQGTVPANLWVRGTLALDPVAVAGMGAQVFAWWGTTAIGPYDLTGP